MRPSTKYFVLLGMAFQHGKEERSAAVAQIAVKELEASLPLALASATCRTCNL